MSETKNSLSWEKYRKGVWFALGTAIISGFSIYLNKFAVMTVKDLFVFTTAKNLVVALLLLTLVILPTVLRELKSLSRQQWLTLILIGGVGGSIPFLLFFKGLSVASAPSAAFIHKTLFIWVTILAVPFLGERLGKFHIAALATLIIGNLVLMGLPSSWALGQAELLVLIATVLWAVEAVIAKKVMQRVSSNVAAFARMFFGAMVMLIYLGFTGKLGSFASLNGQQIGWIAITSLFLFSYVSCYYAGLKYAPASVVASILVLGSVITSLLYAIFDAKRYSWEQVVGMLLVTLAALALWYLSPRVRIRREASPSVSEER